MLAARPAPLPKTPPRLELRRELWEARRELLEVRQESPGLLDQELAQLAASMMQQMAARAQTPVTLYQCLQVCTQQH